MSGPISTAPSPEARAAKVVPLYARGLTTRQIAERFGVSHVTICKDLRERGIERRRAGRRRNGEQAERDLRALHRTGTLTGAAREAGVSVSRMHERLRQYGVSCRTLLHHLDLLDEAGRREFRAALADGLPYHDAIEVALEWIGSEPVDCQA